MLMEKKKNTVAAVPIGIAQMPKFLSSLLAKSVIEKWSGFQ
jgi:hypothetical protein